MSYAPIIRIVLRYVVGALVMGSPMLGEQLANDPDVVDSIAMVVAGGGAVLGIVVEWLYAHAKKTGGAT